MSIVVDASVACAWFMATPYIEAARGVLVSEQKLVAPELVIAELCNISWKMRRAGHISQEQAENMACRSNEYFHELVSLQHLSYSAYKLSAELDHPAYDCFYLALAHEHSIQLITADKRLAKRMMETGYEELVQVISSDH